MQREYHKWHSDALSRDMELLVFGHSGARVIVFPTKAGRFFDYENWGQIEAIADKIEAGHLQLFCVDSIDAESFYCDWCRPEMRVHRHLKFERYILDEVLPFTQQCNPNPFLIAHGCSLGAYHALNIALRHPTRFGKVVSLSGRYDLGLSIGSYRDLFDGYRDEDIYFNNPSYYVPGMAESELLDAIRRLDITIAIGREDVLLENNIRLSQDLSSKGIHHHLFIWDEEAHRPRYWRQMARLYL
jgi:esterase/lipase superfamily enzyme